MATMWRVPTPGSINQCRDQCTPAPPGARAGGVGPPSTFLFTDIEGSTRLWEEQAAAMAALAQHDQLLRQSIEATAAR